MLKLSSALPPTLITPSSPHTPVHTHTHTHTHTQIDGHTILRENNYDMEEGERSVWQQEVCVCGWVRADMVYAHTHTHTRTHTRAHTHIHTHAYNTP